MLLLVVFLCLLVLGLAPRASAAGSGFFSPTGSMGTPREGPAAARLPDGRVLVGGGYATFNIFHTSAEVFNPATGSFSSAGIGSLGTPRAFAAAAPLGDGRVLFAGGQDRAGSFLASAEVFNPATNSFSSAGIGSMAAPRTEAAAAALPDGRVLVVGGGNGASGGPVTHFLSSAEVFDPATNQFSAVSPMGTPRDTPAAAPLPDGRVLVVGGYNPGSDQLSSAEVFNPATNAFSPTGSMGTARSGAAAAALPDGRVLVAGGDQLKSAEVFSPAPGTFSATGIGSMAVRRFGAAAAPLPDGRVLVAGGYYLDPAAANPDHTNASAEIFGPAPSATCRGKQATIVGSIGADQITDTPAADVIAALGGNDKVFGLAGEDVICGGKGNDTLKGGAGNDQLSGQKGNDKLYGQKGKDKLSGNAGNDTLKGGPGKDIVKGGAGKDKQVQ